MDGFEPATSLIRLEPVTENDAAELLDASAGSFDHINRFLGSRHALASADDAEAFVTSWQSKRAAGLGYGFVARESTAGRLVGFGLLNAIHVSHRTGTVGYWVRADACGHGYASAIARSLAEFGFGTLGLMRLEFYVEPGNDASGRVAEKVGAAFEGRLRNRLSVNGQVRDALLYGLIPRDLA